MKAVMHVDDFLESYLDSNINLLAFENQVCDLEKCIHRDIEPTDYISMSTNYHYDEMLMKVFYKKLVILSGLGLLLKKCMYHHNLDIL